MADQGTPGKAGLKYLYPLSPQAALIAVHSRDRSLQNKSCLEKQGWQLCFPPHNTETAKRGRPHMLWNMPSSERSAFPLSRHRMGN